MNKLMLFAAVGACVLSASATDLYVSLETGKNKNEGTKEAPLKNLWKALEVAKDGDTIRLAEGVYPGKMKQNWFLIDKAVSVIGGYSKDFAERNPLVHRTMFQALNENNDKKGNGLGVFTIQFDPAKKEHLESDDDFAKRKVCGACVSSVCLDATGYYYPCPAFAGVNLGSCYEHDLKWIWNESPETLRIRGVTGASFPKCVHCADRAYCSVCMCRNFNETGDLFTPAPHFCEVARVNHEVVDEAQRRRMEIVK